MFPTMVIRRICVKCFTLCWSNWFYQCHLIAQSLNGMKHFWRYLPRKCFTCSWKHSTNIDNIHGNIYKKRWKYSSFHLWLTNRKQETITGFQKRKKHIGHTFHKYIVIYHHLAKQIYSTLSGTPLHQSSNNNNHMLKFWYSLIGTWLKKVMIVRYHKKRQSIQSPW